MRKKYSARLIDKLNYARKNKPKNMKSSNSFRKEYRFLDKSGLNPNQKAVLTYIYDNMKMSVQKNEKFYDKKRHNYYAVVTRQKVADIHCISPDTVGDMLDQLQYIGYIQKVQSWNGGVRVFVHDFTCDSTETGENTESKQDNITSSKKNVSKNDSSTVDTQHTSASNLNTDDRIKSVVQKTIQSIFGDKPMSGSSEKQMDDKKDDEHINYAVNGTKSLPEGAVNRIDKMATNLYGSDKRAKGKFIYGINGLIYRTKSQVAKKNKLHDYFRWENTPELARSFSANIYEMLYGAYSGTRSFKCPKDAYFVGSLKKFFNKFVRKALHKPSKSEKKPQRKHIHEKIPEWAQAGYKPDESGISNERKKELAAKLGNIKA